VVCVTSSIQQIPARRPQGGDDDERIEPGLKIDDDQQVYQHNRATTPNPNR